MKSRILKNKTFIGSFNNAIGGLKYSFRNERNLRFHILAAILIISVCFFTDISKNELLVLSLTICLVIITELLNTAIEVLVNVLIKIYHPKAKIIKDVAAAAVLVATFNAIITGYIIFIDKVGNGLGTLISRIKQYPPNIILIAVLVTVFVVIIVKLIYNKGTPFHGGMPSGHTAVSFAITTAIALWIKNATVVLLCLALSFLVAQSRVEGKIHSVFEVLAGALIGVLVTLFIFKLFYL